MVEIESSGGPDSETDLREGRGTSRVVRVEVSGRFWMWSGVVGWAVGDDVVVVSFLRRDGPRRSRETGGRGCGRRVRGFGFTG